jgi:hypothetical protein
MAKLGRIAVFTTIEAKEEARKKRGNRWWDRYAILKESFCMN